MKQIRVERSRGKDVGALEREALKIAVYPCMICSKIFRYESQQYEHYRRYHQSNKAYTRLVTRGRGHVCKVCPEASKVYADSRALKRHYRDRKVHSAEQLIEAGVLLEQIIKHDDADMQAVRKVYEKAELIHPSEPEAKSGNN